MRTFLWVLRTVVLVWFFASPFLIALAILGEAR